MVVCNGWCVDDFVIDFVLLFCFFCFGVEGVYLVGFWDVGFFGVLCVCEVVIFDVGVDCVVLDCWVFLN